MLGEEYLVTGELIYEFEPVPEKKLLSIQSIGAGPMEKVPWKWMKAFLWGLSAMMSHITVS